MASYLSAMTDSEGIIACDCSEASVASGLNEATANASLRIVCTFVNVNVIV